jgi:uncharacterized protein DUF3467
LEKLDVVQPDVEAKEHPNYRTIIVSGAYGGARPMHFEVVLYSDEYKPIKDLSTTNTLNEKPIVNRTLECRLIIDPFQAKIISQWLTNHVNEYEKQFGRIPSPEEIQVSAASPESANNKNTELYQ